MAKFDPAFVIRIREEIASDYRRMSNVDLIMAAELWIERRFDINVKPSGDSLFWGAILPEMMRRLSEA